MSAGLEVAEEITLGPERYPVLRSFYETRRRVSIIIGPLGCLSGDTEFLTPRGWKRIDAYEPGDQVGAWDAGMLLFANPEAYLAEPCDELIQFEQGNLSMQLSPEHRMLLNDYQGRPVVKLAEEVELYPSRYEVPTTFYPRLRPGIGISDAELRLRVAINADGHHPKAGKQTLFGLRKDRKKKRLRSLLWQTGIEYRESTYPSRPTETIFAFPREYDGKRYEGEWWDLTRHQLKIVLDEMSHWDGLYTTEERRFFSAHKQDADFIQYAAHATGGTATIRFNPGRETERGCYTVYVASEGSSKATRTIREHTKITRVQAPNGMKYCFGVPSGFFLARHRDCVFVTGNSGKTFTVAQRLLTQMCEQEPNAKGERLTRWLVVRNTYGELTSTTYKDFRAIFTDSMGSMKWGSIEPPTFTVHFVRQDRTIVHAEVIFLALDREDAVRHIRGYQLTGVWLSEAAELIQPVVDMLNRRCGRYPRIIDGGVNPTWRGMFGDTNSFDTDHWLYKRVQSPPEEWDFFVQPGGVTRGPLDEYGGATWIENSDAENLANLDDGYYKPSGEAESWIAKNLANEFVFSVDGKPVHPEYRDPLHCTTEALYDPGLPIGIGADFGRTPAAALGQYNEAMDRWTVFDEYVTQDMSASVFGPNLARYLERVYPGHKGLWGFGDPAGDKAGQTVEDTPIMLLNASGLSIKAAYSNIPALRRAAMTAVLTRMGMNGPAFRIHPKAKILRKGLQGGFCFRRLKLGGEERYTEEPDKNMYSHVCEGLEYLLMGGGEGKRATSKHDRRRRQRRDPNEFPDQAEGDR